jgi:hypothetical protein
VDPLASRLCRRTVLFFAAWTAVCNVVVLFGGTLHQLLWVTAIVAVLAGLLRWRRRSSSSPASPMHRTEDPESTPSPPSPRRQLFFALLALAAVTALARGDLVVAWWICMVTLSAALIVETRSIATSVVPLSTPRLEGGLWALAAAGALLALLAIRPSGDDALIVNLAVTAADHPGQPLLRHDGIFGIEGMPIQFPFYRVHSIELLAGAISWLTGIAAIHVMHLALPVVGGLLVVLAHAELFRRIMPRQWLPATLTTLIAYVTMGNDWPSYGFSSLVLLQVPRSICFCVALPLVVAYALDYSRDPTRRNWLRLAAVQVAAIGLSSTALFVAPLLAWITLAASARRGLGSFSRGALASLWVIVMLLAWAGDMRHVVAGLQRQATVALVDDRAAMAMMLDRVFGTGRVALVTSFSVLFAFTVPRSRRARRLLVVLPLAWLFVFANPFWARWLTTELMDPVLFARAAWVLPVPVLMGVTFLAPSRWWGPRWGSLAGLIGILAYGVVVPSHTTLSNAVGTHLGLSATKTPAQDYEAAAFVVEHSPPGFPVLAPSDVATWISTFHDHPPLFTSRAFYHRFLVAQLGAESANRRAAAAQRFAEKAPDVDDADDLHRFLRSARIGAMCYRGRDKPPKPPVREMMLSCGYNYVGRVGVFHCWALRKPIATRWRQEQDEVTDRD